jgi:Holliday junction resolvase RusA-like endonuclease
MWPLRVDVGWPPTANHAYVTTRFGQRVLTRSAKEYQAYVRLLISNTEADWKGGLLVVNALYFKPDNRRRDTDNVRKILADAVAAGLGTDDCWFLWRDQDIRVDRERPRVELTIHPKDTDAAA